MTLKVWRDKRSMLHAECTKCGSYGTAGHLQLKPRLDPDIQAALEAHEAHMLTLREHFKAAANKIVAQVHDGSLARNDGAAKIRELQANFIGQIGLANAALPSPDGKVSFFVDKCPWCDAVEDVEVVDLPEGTDEPAFELAGVVAAAQAKLAAADQSKKGK